MCVGNSKSIVFILSVLTMNISSSCLHSQKMTETTERQPDSGLLNSFKEIHTPTISVPGQDGIQRYVTPLLHMHILIKIFSVLHETTHIQTYRKFHLQKLQIIR